MKDEYYSREEVSNSDLTALMIKLEPWKAFLKPADLKKAFHLGTLVDALVTEPHKVDHYMFAVGEEKYTRDEMKWGRAMLRSLQNAAKKDAFLSYVLQNADGQRWFTNERQPFEFANHTFTLPTRCKFDWWLPVLGFGGDLKTTAATTQHQFEEEIDWVNWDRSRAWYMDVVHSLDERQGNNDFIYAISKKNRKVFFKKIERGDEIYERGKEKYLELAFKLWMLL